MNTKFDDASGKQPGSGGAGAPDWYGTQRNPARKRPGFGIRFCVYCGVMLPDSKKKCSSCGRNDLLEEDPDSTARICTECGKTIPVNSKFCPYCGGVYSPIPNNVDFLTVGADFCLYCGARLKSWRCSCFHCGRNASREVERTVSARNCVQCGTRIPMESVFCPRCGTEQIHGLTPRRGD